MNKDNFKKLIDSILFDGQFKFNMTCFVGKLTTNTDAIKEKNLLASEYGAVGLYQVETTELFNCDSVGCIAGFATALVNNWKTPEWLNPGFQEKQGNQQYNIVQDFEATSNRFLGLTEGQGKKLYYADNDSVWKYLKYYESDRYIFLKYNGEEEGEAEEILDGDCDWDDSEHEINFLSIDYKTAANVLTRIMNEEIVLGDGDGDIHINEPATVGEQNGSI
jgi:hypothetical protein